MPKTAQGLFVLCRRMARQRNDVTLPSTGFRAIRHKSVQDNYCAMRAIPAIILLCTAFNIGHALAEPSAETIALGKALADAADCASCHTADPAKPFAGGKRIDTPFGGIYSPHLTPARDTGLGAWRDDHFYRALRQGIRPRGSGDYP